MNTAKEPPSTDIGEAKQMWEYVWEDDSLGTMLEFAEYGVLVRWDWFGAEPTGTQCAILQIWRHDDGSVFDWRHLQQIKNAVCGPEWEAVEIFPAESRLKDASNARYLWASEKAFPFGIPGGRNVLDAHETTAPQRPFAKRGQT
jgi:hypothetical protein